ncbi:hypothetical protein J41TS12_40490 [Paenibacillus antibioticophila]|uniref:Uncharacterized protein n=2 Tax=Paenibacillus TaxID=44249 RepID=A0A919Y8K0_9BACL|nr:hypothetical protein J41TS12_40490 [Paenibacillus antibioticophila]GIO44330.1 hypothetical protein J41TS4_40880 [Paenibacillus apis]
MVLSLLVDKRKKTSVKMDLILPNGGDFFMAKKGQTFWRYSLELKLEAARLVNEEVFQYARRNGLFASGD